ncbi:glycoside hydrolase [Pseudomonas sp. WS 5111]|uniref:glycoside hydrolase n=1 Tax=unclassified Pseudomonas TaxID=196821 RepID=UPI001474FDC9|nr:MULTISPECIES: glycoside hydrolase [unclassified Pseudomonas]NMX67670.1 glycoside hydrolase [Pseudomonas sp. WS 5111]NMX88359.1 glycoside hydrolase [Pseudomonas sp. WS 5010]
MPRCLRLTLMVCMLLLSPLAVAGTVLENAQWRIELDAATLAVRVTPAGGEPVLASSGVAAHEVSQLQQADQQANWQWDKGAYHLSATLDQRDLILSVTAREAAELDILRQPASAMGKGLIWPLAEGHYIPAGNRLWQDFLLDYGDVNSTQDLSLPLWGVDHASFTLNWLLTNPYNNRLQWHAEGQRLGLTLRHEFTALDPGAPMTLRLNLGEADLLAGAKRYRQWLVEQGLYEPLAQKLQRLPDGEKLLGASHVYLWGNDLLGLGDVRDWQQLRTLLRAADGLGAQLRGLLDPQATQVVHVTQPFLDRYQQAVLLRGLNAALDKKARQGWQAKTEPDMQALAEGYGVVRQALAQEFASALTAPPETWGSTLSAKTIKTLQDSGLPRLLLTLGEGWEGGLWHPEAVRKGVEAGYLMAPYDSYETALADTENLDWTTAHLGSRAYRDCAIMLKNGQLKTGFQKSGHYTDPRCVRPLLQARVTAVQAKAGFNAWFLDAYATGMLFDSYRSVLGMTQAQNAEGNIDAARWIGSHLQLPVGSEDGNATTARGVLFAHGMQTPVMGWGDREMTQDKQSPYYVGAWYPPEEPAVFFKRVPLKEPLRSVYFAPAMRLPLYQAVFHGSVITSHHWLFDSLKLSNVQAENELTQLLYNVPPLYHLSAATLKQRLPMIQRQDGFFRPLHERLATQAMTDFRWLSNDRLVQQTTFADGTRLVANFAQEQRDGYPGRSVTAWVVGESPVVYQVDQQRP